MEPKKFTHDGLEYECRFNRTGEMISMQVFQNNNRTNNYDFSFSDESAKSFNKFMGMDFYNYLLQRAKDDVAHGFGKLSK